MKREVTVVVALSASVMFAAAQPAKESYEPGLRERAPFPLGSAKMHDIPRYFAMGVPIGSASPSID